MPISSSSTDLFREGSQRVGEGGAGLLNIIALCNSLGFVRWDCRAACIRSGYVKLLGVSFFWHCLVLGAVGCSSWPGLGIER